MRSLRIVAAATWALTGPATAADLTGTEPSDATGRGSDVFQHYCAICHGTSADGNGRAAKLYDPRPANLKASRATDAYKELIIRRGGLHVGRSGFMPAWEQELTGMETRDVVAYLRTLAK